MTVGCQPVPIGQEKCIKLKIPQEYGVIFLSEFGHNYNDVIKKVVGSLEISL